MRLSPLFSSILSCVFMSLAGVVGITGCTPAAENTSKRNDDNPSDHVIRIATEGAYPPFNYTQQDGSLGGFEVEVAHALCAQMQQPCAVIAQDWDGIIPGLLAGKYDAIMAGMSVTPERLQKVAFTDPYFSNTMVWLAKNDGSFDAKDISQYTLGGQRATTLGAYLQESFDGKNGNTVNMYDTYENAYLDLKAGRVDAILAEKVAAADWLPNNPDYAIIGEEMDNDDNIAIATRKDDTLKKQFNMAIAALKANGKLAEIEQANFGNGGQAQAEQAVDTAINAGADQPASRHE